MPALSISTFSWDMACQACFSNTAHESSKMAAGTNSTLKNDHLISFGPIGNFLALETTFCYEQHWTPSGPKATKKVAKLLPSGAREASVVAQAHDAAFPQPPAGLLPTKEGDPASPSSHF